MRVTPEAGSCANPQCSAEFRKLGEGRLYVLPVNDPKALNLPATVKQKSVWLCDGCSKSMYIRYDRRSQVVQLCRKDRKAA